MPVNIITSAQIQGWLTEDDGLTPELLEAMSLPETDDGLVLLLDIFGEGQQEPFYVTSNPTVYLRMDEETKEPVYGHVHGGRKYIYCPFQFELYSEEEGGEISSCRLVLQNVDESVTVALRTVTVAMRFRLRIVSMNDPGTVQMDIDFLRLTSVTVTRDTISGELAAYDYGAEPCTPNYTLGEYRTLGNRS